MSRVPKPVLDMAIEIARHVQHDGMTWFAVNRDDQAGLVAAEMANVAIRVARDSGWIDFDVSHDGSIIPNSLRAGSVPL